MMAASPLGPYSLRANNPNGDEGASIGVAHLNATTSENLRESNTSRSVDNKAAGRMHCRLNSF